MPSKVTSTCPKVVFKLISQLEKLSKKKKSSNIIFSMTIWKKLSLHLTQYIGLIKNACEARVVSSTCLETKLTNSDHFFQIP